MHQISTGQPVYLQNLLYQVHFLQLYYNIFFYKLHITVSLGLLVFLVSYTVPIQIIVCCVWWKYKYIFIILGLIIASKPAIKVDEKGLLIYDPFNLIKRIPSDYITQITVQSNTMIIDDKYENATELVDVFYMNKKLRFALDKKDYSRFIEITYIAKKLK